MRRAVLALVVVVAISWAMPLASAQGRTHVVGNCLRATIMPRSIIFTCADGGFYMTQGQWTAWYRFRAFGTAIFHRNDCRPSCAEGTFHSMRGRIVLFHRERCPGLRRHGRVFTRAMITMDEQLLGHRRYRARLTCPA